jgi:hypothetical protein
MSITKLPAGDRKISNLFYSVLYSWIAVIKPGLFIDCKYQRFGYEHMFFSTSQEIVKKISLISTLARDVS